jgi:RNA polymerase sigma factor (sigma-70 family)
MDDNERLAGRFEELRPHLRRVAYRMLGSPAEADDAVQDTWERASRAGTDGVGNLKAWLTTIVARVCLNMLRSRTTRHEQSLEGYVPDPIVSPPGGLDPEEEALLADTVGLALQVVIDTLAPAERLAFVLHDMFDLPFEEIAHMLGRTPQATRQLASRARRRIKGAEIPPPERNVGRQRAVVDAFFAAGRAGDLDALVGLLHPDVVARTDYGPSRPGSSTINRGAAAVARQARLGARSGGQVHPALVNGAAGAVITVKGRPFGVMAFNVSDDRIVAIDIVVDPGRVARLAAPVLADLEQQLSQPADEKGDKIHENNDV